MISSKQETKKVPELRFPGFSSEWQVLKLGDIAKIYDGTHQTPEYVKEGVPFYSVEQVTANDFKHTKFVAESVYLGEKIKPENGDILMTRIGDIGTTKYLDWNVRASYYVSLALIKKSDRYNGRFLEKYISTDSFQKELWKRTIHVAFPKKINLGEISTCVVKQPAIDEQDKIAGFLTAVDDRVAATQQKVELLKKYKKSVMQKIFTQQIRFKDENSKDYPAWEEKTLGDLGKFKSGTGFSDNQQGGKSGVPFFKVSDMNLAGNAVEMTVSNNFVTTEQIELMKYKPIIDKSIIFAKVGAAIFLERKRVAQNFLIDNNMMAYTPNKTLKFDFAKIIMDRLRLSKMAQVGALPSYNGSDLAIIILELPCIEEQQKIADFLSAVDDKIQAEEAKLTAAKTFKKALLQRMFV
jgi:type I restriction enzyme S subunit